MKTFDELPERKTVTKGGVRKLQKYAQYLKDLELLWHRGEKGWGLLYDASGQQEEDALISRKEARELRSVKNRDKDMEPTALVAALKQAAVRQEVGFMYEFRVRGDLAFGRYTGGA